MVSVQYVHVFTHILMCLARYKKHATLCCTLNHNYYELSFSMCMCVFTYLIESLLSDESIWAGAVHAMIRQRNEYQDKNTSVKEMYGIDLHAQM